VEVSRRYLGAADVVVLCLDGPRSPEGEEATLAADPRTLVVRTKADATPPPADAEPLVTSAVTGAGLAALRQAVARRAFGAGSTALAPTLLRARHRDALATARAELAAARPHVGPAGDALLAAHHVRAATEALEELMGVVPTDEVLGRVFASFCVGK
jgi:tRNA modification GTPase